MEWYPCSYSGGDWDSVLDIYNYSSKIGRINNRLTLDHGSYVGAYTGTNGSTGYVNFARIKIINTYNNYPCVFLISGRAWNTPALVCVNFISSNSSDPTLSSFYRLFSTNFDVYIYKTDTSQWDLYAPKNEAYGRIDILHTWYSSEHFEISYPNGHVATANSAWTKAVTAGIVNVANCIRDKTNGNPSYLDYAGGEMTPDGNTQYLAMWINSNNEPKLRPINKSHFMQTKYLNGYYGMCSGGYNDITAIRTPKDGILPYQAGRYSTAIGLIGNDSNWFSEAYIKEVVSQIARASEITSTNGTMRMYMDDGSYKMTFEVDGKPDYKVVLELANGVNSTKPAFYPNYGSNGTLGRAYNKWNQIYATNGTIQTSDKNEKKEISYIGKNSDYDTYMDDETLKSFIHGLLPVIYNRINGESGRPHHGFIAQDIEELLQKLGIKDHAGFIKSPKTETVEIEEEAEETYTDEMDGQVKTRTVTKKREEQKEIPGEYIYGLRYEEFIADIVRFVQIQDEKIEEQERKINSLEGRLSALENMLNASTG